MDFVIRFLKVEGCNKILVMVENFSKYVTPHRINAIDAAKRFFKHIVKYLGIPQTIMSDHDDQFIGLFWTGLFKILGPTLNFSTTFHP